MNTQASAGPRWIFRSSKKRRRAVKAVDATERVPTELLIPRPPASVGPRSAGAILRPLCASAVKSGRPLTLQRILFLNPIFGRAACPYAASLNFISVNFA
jgi:hypothetical protein